MSSTSESNSAYSSTESTTTEQTESKINTNTQTIGQVSQTY